ncbi:MAG: hypothetical protein JNL58_29905 [Planctomyces sp.]|nr:hypothetical protein [Planctomyces sp.]
MPVPEIEALAWVQRLESLGFAIQEYVSQLLTDGTPGLHLAVAEQGGDTVYAIDRYVEPIVEKHIELWGHECRPLLLIAEGMGVDGRRRFGSERDELRYRVIIDPIDGTRGLMYDKRSAWFLAAVAKDRGEQTGLQDTFASVMIELPTSKQHLCDSISAIAGNPTLLKRTRIGGAEPIRRVVSPSTSTGLAGGFGQVVSFFQGTKGLAAELMETIAAELIPPGTTSQSAVLDDQYISTGGQMAELILGHDRFCCDLRPLMYQIQRRNGPFRAPELVCHPYDAAGLLTALQSGVIITDGFGRNLDAALDVFQPVHWCGYANAELQSRIEPIIQRWLRGYGVTP